MHTMKFDARAAALAGLVVFGIGAAAARGARALPPWSLTTSITLARASAPHADHHRKTFHASFSF